MLQQDAIPSTGQLPEALAANSKVPAWKEVNLANNHGLLFSRDANCSVLPVVLGGERVLRVQSNRIAPVELGESHRPGFRLQTKISAADWHGAGVFFGYRPADGRGTKEMFRAVELRRDAPDTPPGSFVIVETVYTRKSPDIPFMRWGISLEKIVLDTRDSSHELEVEVRGQEVVAYVDGRVALPPNRRKSASSHLTPSPVGILGVSSREGTTTIHRFQFMD